MDIKKITVIRLKGRMDALSAQAFEQQLRPLEGPDLIVVVDMEELEYVSSAGLRSILAVTKKIQAGNGQIRFCNVKGLVDEIFRCANLASVIPICKSWKEAIF
jgi:anti-sigma B factor antagonist